MKKESYRAITGTIHCVSGLRVGGSDDLLQIGGTDLTCIKHPVTLQPYLPGSSIKGKMRSELEKSLGRFGGRNLNEPCGCARRDCLVCRVFGPHKNTQHQLGPSRIIVRDAQVVEGGQIETKSENVNDRQTGTAQHPRKVERVVAGTKFGLKIVLQIWDLDAECRHRGACGGDALVEFVKDGLGHLAATGIGAGVSKGYGEIEFLDLRLDGQPLSL